MKKNDDSCCMFFLLLALLGGALYVIYSVLSRVVEFVQSPDALSQVVQFLEGLGLCVGAAILLIVILSVYFFVSDKIARIRSHWIVRKSPEFPVLCTPILMQKWVHGELPHNLVPEAGQESRQPIFCSLTLTDHGLAITTPAGAVTQSGSEFPLDLFGRAWSDTAFLSLGTARLYYVPLRPGQTQELVTFPDGAPGFHDRTPSVATGDQLEISLVVQCIIYMRNLDSAPWLEYPLKLKIRVLDANGREDVQRAVTFYAMLHSAIAAAQAPDDDDSWMYHSRPIFW